MSQEVFLEIVDLLERNDEFNSLHDDDDSTFGGDEEPGAESDTDSDYSDEASMDDRRGAEKRELKRPLFTVRPRTI